MSLRIEAGFDTAVVGGDWEMEVNEGSGTVTVTLTAGRYCHTDISSLLSGDYTALADQLESDLNASALAETYTVTYDPATMAYTISATGTFTVESVGDPLENALGFPDSFAVASSVSSTRRPYYVISAAMGCKSNVSDDYEPDDVVSGSESEDGTPYNVARTSAPKYHDFSVLFEPKSATFERSATSAVPWTWEHFFPHVRGSQPMLVVDSSASESTVHVLKPKSGRFKPTREQKDWDDGWRIDFATVMQGRL